MVMMHKIKAKKIVPGRFGRKKTVEVDVYVPSTYTHISEMAGHAAGVSDGEAAYATHIHAHYGDNSEEYIFVGKNKGYDEFAYDALIGILGGIASWKYGVGRIDEKYLQILTRRGQKNGDAYYAATPVKEIRSNYEPHLVGTVVQLPSFDEFIEKHGDYLKLMLLEEILSKSPKRLPKDEEKK